MLVDTDVIHHVAGINKFKDRAESHLLKIMYKRAQDNQYLDVTEGHYTISQ